MSTVPNSASKQVSAAGELMTSLGSTFIPPLVDGDHLSRAEFHRRYENTPEKLKAELIAGVVYMASPVSCFNHSKQDAFLHTWAGVYSAATPGTEFFVNGTILLNDRNEPQPDSFMRIRPEFGGQSTQDESYVIGAPELIIEVSASSARKDLKPKFQEFQSSGVRDYIVWQINEGILHWFQLKDGKFVPQLLTKSGVLESETFPGLWLDVTALLRHDQVRVLAKLQEGISSVEHQAFVDKLQRN